MESCSYRVVMSDEHVLANRASWDADADQWVERGRQDWAREEIAWGVWGVEESELVCCPARRPRRRRARLRHRLLLGVDGAAWRARGRPGQLLDSSPPRAVAARAHVPFPLIHGDAEHAPFRDASFDLAISEYGAAIWCDPYRWIPKRRGCCARRRADLPRALLPIDALPPGRRAADRRVYWCDRLRHASVRVARQGGAVEFQIPHGDMIRFLRSLGSRSKICWRTPHPMTLRHRPIPSPPPIGPAPGGSKKSGRRASSRDIASFREPSSARFPL